MAPERDRYSPAVNRAIAWGGFVLLLVLHHDFWRPQRAVLYFGWLPEELAWRLGFVVLSVAYLVFFCRSVWREEDA